MPIPFDDYLAIKAVNCSFLKDFERSPAHAYAKNLDPKREPPSPVIQAAFDYGTGVHCYLLEGEKTYQEDIVVRPEFSRTKADQEKKKAFEKSVGKNQTVISSSQNEEILACCNSALKVSTVEKLCRQYEGQSEETIQWIDEVTRVACKGRLDRLVTIDGRLWIIDVKTTQDARPDAFQRSINNFLYHWQAAFYLDGVRAAGYGEPLGFIWVVIEKKKPYGVKTYKASDALIQHGRDGYRSALRKYLECSKKPFEEWDGYTSEIEEIDLPRWAKTTPSV
jgi:hypothetical protein